MPLKKGSSRKVISQNIHHLVHDSKYPVKRAVAAALNTANYKAKGKGKKKSKK